MADRAGGMPIYPIAFTLVQAQALNAVRCFKALLNAMPEMAEDITMPATLEEDMLRAVRQLMRTGATVAVDEQGPLEGATTDPLHALWYLRKTDVDATTLRNIGEQLVSLESTHGYLTAKILQFGTYHNDVLWSFEQAFLHAAARRFGLTHSMKVTELAGSKLIGMSHLGLFPERVNVRHKGLAREAAMGPHTQQWTICAAIYFGSWTQDKFHIHQSPEVPPTKLAGCDKQSGADRYTAHLMAALRGHLTNSSVPQFSCFDGEGQGVLNDGNCDCVDGSDEPSTNACASQLERRSFVCQHGQDKISYSQVGDGLCDCCDGSDEQQQADIHCPYSCWR